MRPANVPVAADTLTDAQRLALRGEVSFDVYGCRIVARRLPRVFFPPIGRWTSLRSLGEGTWDVHALFLRQAIEQAVVDWGGLSYEDLWRDPCIGFKVARGIISA